MPSVIDYDNLEQNIHGVFLDFLRKGGIEVDNLDALAKIRHNTFEAALGAVRDKLFKADKPGENNQQSILPYDDNYILNILINIYINLCTMCNKSTGLYGFSTFTGFYYSTLRQWERDQLNPERMTLIKRITENRQHIHINRLQDTSLGDVAVANNDAELGLMWAKNNAPQVAQKAVYILPAEQTRKEIASGLPYEISKADTQESA